MRTHQDLRSATRLMGINTTKCINTDYPSANRPSSYYSKAYAKKVIVYPPLRPVATYPFAGERGEAHRCVFQMRKMRGVATNVDKSGALAPTYPPSKRKSGLRSSFKRGESSDSFLLGR
ncbi:hypothetical protein HKD37_02G004919 [Glycine soja]